MRILLADDHQMMRDGLRALLEREPDLQVVGEAADGRAAVELCGRLQPDLVVMDIGMAGLNGIDATRQLTAQAPRVRVVALTMNTDRSYVLAMFEAGAMAYLVKSAAADELIRAIRAVARGQKFVSSAVAGAVVDGSSAHLEAEPAGRRRALTPREREVLQLLSEGKTTKEIAAQLELAAQTVETYRKQIMAKLELRSVAELTKYAIRAGLTTLD
jgi:DNA-binding NarL/FixJ family response regulator